MPLYFLFVALLMAPLLIPYAINLSALLSSLHNEHFYPFFYSGRHALRKRLEEVYKYLG